MFIDAKQDFARSRKSKMHLKFFLFPQLLSESSEMFSKDLRSFFCTLYWQIAEELCVGAFDAICFQKYIIFLLCYLAQLIDYENTAQANIMGYLKEHNIQGAYI